MNLQNGYKVIYEKAADGKRSFYASKTGVFADAELIAEATIGEYKLIYEKDGSFYGSTTGIPTENDYCFEDFKKVFVAETTEQTNTTSVPEETTQTAGTSEDDLEEELEDELDGSTEEEDE